MTDHTSDAPQRLLDAALEVFATKGYSSASTREICRLADANVSAIHYYFGDKASLYRQLFERVDQFLQVPPELARADTSLDDGLLSLYRHLLGFKLSPVRSQLMRALLVREQLQPSGLLSETQLQGLKPFYVALLALLQRHMAVLEADSRLQHLAFGLLGLPSVLMIDREMVDSVAPGLFEDREESAQEFTQQARAMVQHESIRRATCRKIMP